MTVPLGTDSDTLLAERLQVLQAEREARPGRDPASRPAGDVGRPGGERRGVHPAPAARRADRRPRARDRRAAAAGRTSAAWSRSATW